MRSPLARSMDTGLVISFYSDTEQFQEVFVNWQQRPLPAPGDEVACTIFDPSTGLPRRHVGKVLAPRRIEVCRDAQGTITTWVRLRAELRGAEEVQRHEGNGAATNGKRRNADPSVAGR